MRAFDSLTERGRASRLRRLALAASTRYAFEPRRCVFAASSFNTIFRIDASDEGRYALRVGSATRIHPEGTEAAEVAWMAALRRDAAVDVPAVVEASDGTNVLDVEVPGVPERRLMRRVRVGPRTTGRGAAGRSRRPASGIPQRRAT